MNGAETVELTLVAVPGAFAGALEAAQLNAIRSWTQLKPKPQIILIGREEGVRRTAETLALDYIEEVGRNEFGTPLMSSVLSAARRLSKGRALCFLPADVILTRSFMDVFTAMKQKRFLFAGQCLNLEIESDLNLEDPNWDLEFHRRADFENQLLEPRTPDYVIFSRDDFDRVPPFALGGTATGSWFILEALRKRIPVFDLTEGALAIRPAEEAKIDSGSHRMLERERNISLLGGSQFGKVGLGAADFKFTEGRIIPVLHTGAELEEFKRLRKLAKRSALRRFLRTRLSRFLDRRAHKSQAREKGRHDRVRV